MTGASRGVGRGVAVALGQAGWAVYVTARSSAAGRTGHLPGTVEQTADAVTAVGGHASRCRAITGTTRRSGGRRPDHGGSRPPWICSSTTRGRVTNGSMRTEGVLQFADQVDLSASQSPEGVGRAIVALAGNPEC